MCVNPLYTSPLKGKLRVQIAERKKNKEEDIKRYREEARKEFDRLVEEELLAMKDRLDK